MRFICLWLALSIDWRPKDSPKYNPKRVARVVPFRAVDYFYGITQVIAMEVVS
jgi:hypothetical protein